MDKDLHTRVFESPFINTRCPSFDPILSYGHQKFYRKGEIIIDIGDIVDQLHYMHKGQIKMSAMAKSGLEKTIWYMDAPTIFGETPFFHSQPSKFVMEASRDCEIYQFERDYVLDELPEYPEIMTFAFKLLAQKVRILSAQIEDLAFNEPVTRVANLIHVLVCQSGKKTSDNSYVLNMRLTHQEIADITGLHRVTASNALKRLCEDGLIEKSRAKIVVPNLTFLEELINDS